VTFCRVASFFLKISPKFLPLTMSSLRAAAAFPISEESSAEDRKAGGFVMKQAATAIKTEQNIVELNQALYINTTRYSLHASWEI
jgi:hypothetical protein